MGWISNFKTKRANKAATEEFELAHANWELQLGIFKKAEQAFQSALKGIDSVQNYVVQRNGEVALWSGQGVFHEVGKTPSRYVGSSSGISIPIIKGVRYRVGATSGTLVPGDEYQMDKDEGNVLITTQRIIFSGTLKTQEWLFEKMIGALRSADELDFVINVSNRQKSSGIRFDSATGKEFGNFLALSMSAVEDGIAAVLKELATEQEKLIKEEPKLNLQEIK